MSKNGLKKVYLIKSAGYEFAEIDVGKNTLLLGESGVGKTTIMRAVLFFYTMDYSDSVLNLTSDTKKSFNDWYFKEYNSHIVYEYEKEQNRFLFVVSKTGKLNYSFIDITNTQVDVKSLFIDEKMPVTLEKLNEKVQKENLPNYATTIREKYINTFHQKDANNKKIKHESLVDFSLFQSVNHSKEFAKTLSNIFISSRVSSNSVKKSIVSLIDKPDAKINLNEIRVNLFEYVSHKDEIEKFEKKIPAIEKLSEKFSEFNTSRKNFKISANKLQSLKKQALVKKQEITLKINNLSENERSLKENFALGMGTLNKEIQTASTKTIEKEKELRELQAKEKEYQEKNIDTLVDTFTKEKEYQNNLQTYKDRYTALTSEFENLQERYETIVKSIKTDADDSIFTLRKSNLAKSKKISSDKNELIAGKDQSIKEETQRYTNEKELLESKLKEKEREFNTLEKELIRVEHFNFNQEEINKYTDEIKAYEEALVSIKIAVTKNEVAIKQIELEILGVAKNLKSWNETLDEKVKKKKENLFQEKDSYEMKLDFAKDNLYGYLHKNNIANKEKIVTYLKDEILFTEKKFTFKKSDNKDSIFGMELEFEERFENDYEQSKLLSGLKLVKENIKLLNKETIRKKRETEDEASRDTKIKNRQRAILYKEKEDLDLEQKSYAQNINSATLKLTQAKQNALNLQKQKTLELQKQHASLSISKEEISKQIASLSTTIESMIQEIHESVQNAVLVYEEELFNLEKDENTQVREIELESSKKIEATYKELSESLQNNGVDKALIDSISQEIDNINTILSQIEANRMTVMVYLCEYKEKILQLPALESELRNVSQLLSDLQEKKIESKRLNKLQSLDLTKSKEVLEKVQFEIDSFLKSYTLKIENHEIEKKIQENLNLDTYTLDESITISPVIVDEIIQVYTAIKSAQESIKSSVQEIIRSLKSDNIFKIEIPSDFNSDSSYLKTAKELIEYIKNDKLSLFKDASLDKFKSSVNSISKQLNFFEEALLDVESEVQSLSNGIRKAIDSFVVIDDINIRYLDSNNEVLTTLQSLVSFYENNNEKFLSGLFDSNNSDVSSSKARKELREKIIELVELLNTSKEYLELENGFVIEFKVVEKGNDLKWRQALDDIGSNGTSTLVKSIINISMLKMVSKNIVKNYEITTHCILDEIGTISTEYFKELKNFVNDSGFVFLNGMPTEDDMLISMYPNIYVGKNFGTYSKMIFASKVDM